MYICKKKDNISATAAKNYVHSFEARELRHCNSVKAYAGELFLMRNQFSAFVYKQVKLHRKDGSTVL